MTYFPIWPPRSPAMRTAELASDTVMVSKAATRRPVRYFISPPLVRANRVGSLCVMREAAAGLVNVHGFVWAQFPVPYRGNKGSPNATRIEPGGTVTAGEDRSERLGDLAQAGRAVGIESVRARRLLDHPVGRNEHGDRIGSGIVFAQPRQRAKRTADEMQRDVLRAQFLCQRIHRGGRFIHQAHHDDRRA